MNHDIEEFLDTHAVLVEYDKDYDYPELEAKGYRRVEWENKEYYVIRKSDYNEIERLIFKLLMVPVKAKRGFTSKSEDLDLSAGSILSSL